MEFPEPQPTLATERLVLRPFAPDDAPAVVRLAGDRRVADTTLNIPHPYPEGSAGDWIAGREVEYARGGGVTWAITERETGQLLGAIGLHCNSRFQLLHRIHASHFARNAASGRVMEKVGMRREGVWRQHVKRDDGPFEDAVVYGILRGEWRP